MIELKTDKHIVQKYCCVKIKNNKCFEIKFLKLH